MIFVLSFIALLFCPSPILALDFSQAQADYQFRQSQYQSAYQNYLSKREIHTKYQTITTKSEKITATKDAITARNTALKYYLIALKSLLSRFQTFNPDETDNSLIAIDNWITYLEEQNTIVSSLNNEVDLSQNADEFRLKWVLIQQSVYSGLIQHHTNYQSLILDQITSLSQFIQASPRLQSESQTIFSSLPIKYDQVKVAQQSAAALANKKQYYNRFNNFYPDAKAELTRAHNYLVSLTSDLNSVVIKYLSL